MEQPRLVTFPDLMRFMNDQCDETVKAEVGSIDDEIAALQQEIEALHVETLPWDRHDVAIVFLAAIIGAAIDVFIGNPEGYKEPTIRDDSLLGLGKWLKQYDIRNNPIDARIPGVFGGNHRLYSYGHDLFRLLSGIRAIMNGGGPVGIDGSGDEVILQAAEDYPGYGPWAALVILLIHLTKDFLTKRSLPIPGSTWIATLNNNEMPAILEYLDQRGVNLRQQTSVALSVMAIDLAVSVPCQLRYRNADVRRELVQQKQDVMLLTAHSVAALVNVGKIVHFGNPFLLNWWQMLRLVRLGYRVAREAGLREQKSHLKVTLSQLKTEYQLLRTVILLDKTLVVTNQAHLFVQQQLDDLGRREDVSEQSVADQIAEMQQLLDSLQELSDQTKDGKG